MILRSPPTAQRFFRRIQPQKLPLLGLPFVPTVNPVILRSLPTAQRFFRRIQPQKSPLLRLVFDSKLFNPVLHLQPSSPQLSRNPRLIFPFPPFPPAHLLCYPAHRLVMPAYLIMDFMVASFFRGTDLFIFSFILLYIVMSLSKIIDK